MPTLQQKTQRASHIADRFASIVWKCKTDAGKEKASVGERKYRREILLARANEFEANLDMLSPECKARIQEVIASLRSA